MGVGCDICRVRVAPRGLNKNTLQCTTLTRTTPKFPLGTLGAPAGRCFCGTLIISTWTYPAAFFRRAGGRCAVSVAGESEDSPVRYALGNNTCVLFVRGLGRALARVRAGVLREGTARRRRVATALHLAGERPLARVCAGVRHEMAALRR